MGLPINVLTSILEGDEITTPSAIPPYDIEHFKRTKPKSKRTKADRECNQIQKYDERTYVLPTKFRKTYVPVQTRKKRIGRETETIKIGDAYNIIFGSWLHLEGSITGCQAYQYTLSELKQVAADRIISRDQEKAIIVPPMGESEEFVGICAIVLDFPPPSPQYVASNTGATMTTQDAKNILAIIKNRKINNRSYEKKWVYQ